ncbi:acetyl-CoA carboxylase biotin carboxyl carrier protein subunit [bacterium]|nr:MAG: acetyl-CoA carboxylase biotin carboxyl carrier protein subunit [bacterium]
MGSSAATSLRAKAGRDAKTGAEPVGYGSREFVLSKLLLMDLDLVRHALAAARRHGYAEVELGEGEASFTARLAKGAKPKTAPKTEAGPIVDEAPKEIKATLVGFYREAKTPLEVGRTIRKGDAIASIEALGIVTDVSSKVEGEVIEILVEPGQAVEYGQVLARVKA